MNKEEAKKVINLTRMELRYESPMMNLDDKKQFLEELDVVEKNLNEDFKYVLSSESKFEKALSNSKSNLDYPICDLRFCKLYFFAKKGKIYLVL